MRSKLIRRLREGVMLASLVSTLAGCAALPRLQMTAADPAGDGPAADAAAPARAPQRRSALDVLRTPERPPPASPEASGAAAAAATPEQIAALVPEDARIEAALPPQPLPRFIDTVFGELLRVPYSTGPGVSERNEIISLRGPVSASGRGFLAMVQSALADYGLLVTIENGAARILSSERLVDSAPLIFRSRSGPSTPEPSRPVIQFFELQAVTTQSAMTLLDESYPNRGAVRFTAKPETNSIIISGTAREVAAAAAVLQALDQPRFADGFVARMRPTFWSAERLADAAVEVLATEGYFASRNQSDPNRALVLLPIANTDLLFVFSNREDAFERAVYWLETLDSPASIGSDERVFIYKVQNTSAAELGALIGRFADASSPEQGANPTTSPLAGRGGPARRAVQNTTPQSTGEAGAGAAGTGSARLTVDEGGNRLLFFGTAAAYEQLRPLMEELDTPPQQVLVEVTIAEVTLTDRTQFGVEWFVNEAVSKGAVTAQLGTPDTGGGGLNVNLARTFTSGSLRVALNALAENNNVNILSTPRLVARSGGEAEIQVGTDVPIITSQRAANQQTGGSTDVLQTVQYRQTGVLLTIKPIVYGNDRIELEISQEVSSDVANPNEAIASPLILNRNVTTELSLREGTTAVLAGLIQDSYTRGQSGVPLLKDIPLLGAAFRNDTVEGTKTELLLLITPYVLDDEAAVADIADRAIASLNRTLRRRGPQTYTLLPYRTPFQPSRRHGALLGPSPAATNEPPPAAADAAPAPGTEATGAHRLERLAPLAPSPAPPEISDPAPQAQ